MREHIQQSLFIGWVLLDPGSDVSDQSLNSAGYSIDTFCICKRGAVNSCKRLIPVSVKTDKEMNNGIGEDNSRNNHQQNQNTP